MWVQVQVFACFLQASKMKCVYTSGQVHSELRLSFHPRGAFWPIGDTVMNTLNRNPPAMWTALVGGGVEVYRGRDSSCQGAGVTWTSENK